MTNAEEAIKKAGFSGNNHAALAMPVSPQSPFTASASSSSMESSSSASSPSSFFSAPTSPASPQTPKSHSKGLETADAELVAIQSLLRANSLVLDVSREAKKLSLTLECSDTLSIESAQQHLKQIGAWCQKTYPSYTLLSSEIDSDDVLHTLHLKLKTPKHAEKLHALLQQSPLFSSSPTSPTLSKQ